MNERVISSFQTLFFILRQNCIKSFCHCDLKDVWKELLKTERKIKGMEDVNSSKVNMGLVLREKEKVLIDILSRHPALNGRLGEITEKVDLEIILSKTMRSRSKRYEEDSNESTTFSQDVDRYRKSAIDLESISNQTLIDMENLKLEKEKIIKELKKQILEKDQQIEEYLNRSTMIKHYANLLIKSSNIYIHKRIEEIQESDKVISFNYQLLLLLFLI